VGNGDIAVSLPHAPFSFPWSPAAVDQSVALLAEADLIMAVDGCPTLADLTPEALRHVCGGRGPLPPTGAARSRPGQGGGVAATE
jgi:hypothetical protein